MFAVLERPCNWLFESCKVLATMAMKKFTEVNI